MTKATYEELELVLENSFGIDINTVPEDDLDLILEVAQDELDYYDTTPAPHSSQSALQNAILRLLLE